MKLQSPAHLFSDILYHIDERGGGGDKAPAQNNDNKLSYNFIDKNIPH